jgi:large subunit ribosomal protein L21
MYAVIETGGKQYRVEVGTELEVERLDVEAGGTITLDRVLLVVDGDSTAIGRPVVADAAVSAQVVRQDRGDKVIVFKYRPKARRRVKKGHRQDFTLLRVTDVRLGAKSAADLARKADQEAKTERQRLEEAAARQAAEDAALAAKLAARSKTDAAGEAGATPKPARKATAAKAAPKATAAKAAPKATAAKVAPKEGAAEPKASTTRSRTKTPETTETSTAEAPKRTRAKKDE